MSDDSRGLTARGLQHTGEVFIQDGLGILVRGARQERQGMRGELRSTPYYLSVLPFFLLAKNKHGITHTLEKKPQQFHSLMVKYKPNPLQTSWICWSLSSGELRVSCSLFRLSRREMSLAANSAGSIGTISFGGHRVRFVRKDIKLAVVSLPKHQPYVNFFKDFLSTYLITLKHCSPSVPSSLLVVLIRALS